MIEVTRTTWMSILSIIVILSIGVAIYVPTMSHYCLHLALFSGVYLFSQSINLGRDISTMNHLLKVLKNAVLKNLGKETEL